MQTIFYENDAVGNLGGYHGMVERKVKLQGRPRHRRVVGHWLHARLHRY